MIGKIFDKGIRYVEAKLNIIKLSAIERISILMGFLMLMIISMIGVLTIFIFVGVGMGIYFGEITGSAAGGYFITAGIYLIVFSTLILFKKSMLRAFANLFVNLLTDDVDKDENSAH